jgi:bacterioferritin
MSDSKNEKTVALLVKAYNAELETVMNYLANSIHLDGFRAKHIKDSLAADVTEEIGHAQQLAARIKVLEGTVPGSQAMKWTQTSLQPPVDKLDVLSVIKGVIEAEEGAIKLYQSIIEAAEEAGDPVTADLCTTIKGDEEEHRREFKGYLAEVEAMLV